jgi:hypothetical protein
MESRPDHNDTQTRQTSKGSQLIETDQPTPNNKQNLRKIYAQEITSDIR